MDIEEAVEEAMMQVSAYGDDTQVFSQGESAEFYTEVARQCTERAQLIVSEMD